MLKVILVLLYIYGGEVVLEQKPATSMEACSAVGEARAMELMLDPKFDEGLFGSCIPLSVVEAKAEEKQDG